MANRIRELREEQHMTQVRLSVELGVSQETVSAYESGKHFPSVATLLQLSELLHASMDYILGKSNVRMAESVLTLEEETLLSRYRRLPKTKQERLQAYLEGLSE